MPWCGYNGCYEKYIILVTLYWFELLQFFLATTGLIKTEKCPHLNLTAKHGEIGANEYALCIGWIYCVAILIGYSSFAFDLCRFNSW